MKQIEYDSEGKPIIPEGYRLIAEKQRVRNGISEKIPAHLRKLPGPRNSLAKKAEGMFSGAMKYNLTNKTLTDAPESKVVAIKIIRAIKSEICYLLDKLEKSL